jgi:cyanophycinase-like exopeptidase
MGQAGPLRWHDGRGWLVLVGGGDWADMADIARSAVEAMSDESPVVFVPAAGATPEEGRDDGARVVAQLERLGAPAGYVAPIFARTDAADPKNARRLMNAGLVCLGDGQARRLVETLTDTPTLKALAAAYRAGAVVVAEGQAAGALGGWYMNVGEQGHSRGWGWLPDAIICSSFDDAVAPPLRTAIKSHPECLGLGIPKGVALALGPESQVQTLGASGVQVTVILGSRFGQSS